MSYFSTDSGGLGSFGCGAGCSCKQCRSDLAEVYEEEEIPERAPSRAAQKIGAWFGEPLPPQPSVSSMPGQLRMPAFETLTGYALDRGFGQPTVAVIPPFRFTCPVGCPPHAANECRAVVGRAIRDAIFLAESAATKLEARDNEAVRLFRFFFGDPSRPVPWADNRQAADLVAFRYRAVADGFRKRVPHIRCGTVAAGDCGATANAYTRPRHAPTPTIPFPHNTIVLCPPFWGPSPPGTDVESWRSAILLHEMLHLLFWEFFGHQVNLPRPGDPEERRRDNAHCYEAFALRVAKHGADPADVTACTNRPM